MKAAHVSLSCAMKDAHVLCHVPFSENGRHGILMSAWLQGLSSELGAFVAGCDAEHHGAAGIYTAPD